MIVTDETLLRVKCTDVLPEEIAPLLEQLERELQRSNELGRPGIGLAAPQIGVAKNMAIVRIPKQNGEVISINLVNCKIKEGYDLAIFDGEGCLSFPGRTERTRRFQEILVTDNAVEPERFVASGIVAVCIQHELDHTKGILLPDISVDRPKSDPVRGLI